MSKPTVMITGAGIGIGEATALAFGRAGYHVYVTDVLDEEGRGTVAAIEAEGGSAAFSHVDVTDTANVDAAVAAAEAATGPLDAAIANAGIAHKVPFAEMSDEKWDHTLDVDLTGCPSPAARRSARDARGGAAARWSPSPRSWARLGAGTTTCSTTRPSPAWWGSCAASPATSAATASA